MSRETRKTGYGRDGRQGEGRGQERERLNRKWKSLIESAAILAVGLFVFFVWGHRIPGTAIMCVACFVMVSGLFIPPAYSAFKRMGAYIARAAGAGLTWLLLAPFFYLCFVPGRLILAVLKKDPMARKFSPDISSYWIERTGANDPARYTKQF